MKLELAAAGAAFEIGKGKNGFPKNGRRRNHET